MKNEIRCEVPNSDAHRIFCSMAEVRRFLAHHDVKEFERDEDHAGRLLIRVPAFQKSRERFSNWKAEECARWGCE